MLPYLLWTVIIYYSFQLKKSHSLLSSIKNIRFQQVTEKKASQVIEIYSWISLLLKIKKIKILPYNAVYILLFFSRIYKIQPGNASHLGVHSFQPKLKGKLKLSTKATKTLWIYTTIYSAVCILFTKLI